MQPECAGGAATALRAAVLLNLVAACAGHAHYQALIPNGRNVPGYHGLGAWHAVGHVAPRPQGIRTCSAACRATVRARLCERRHRWTVELCRKDSDADGRTNGEELGDPACVGAGMQPGASANITHPA